MRGEVRHALRERQILDTACALLREHGFVNVSMDDVARASGVGKATLYKHFDSKEELVVATIVDQMSRAEAVFAALPDDLPALERLRLLLVEGIEKRTRYAPIPVSQVPSSVEHHPLLVQELDRMQERMERLLDEARAGGELVTDVPTPVIAAHLMATFGAELDGTAARLGTDPGALARQLASVVFDGIRAR